MRKLILSTMVSIDNFMEGPNQELDWPVSVDENGIIDKEMEQYFTSFFNEVDYFLYGRKSYELMIQYWPTLDTPFAKRMNEFPKIIFSKTLKEVTWNSRLVKENAVEEIKKLKAQPGKDLVLFAGADIAKTFIDHNMIDEYRLLVNPVVLGAGKPLFDIHNPIKLKLIRAQNFACGVVILYYKNQ